MPRPWILLLLLLFFLSACGGGESRVLTIAAAANLQGPLDDLTGAFTAQTGIPTKTVLASSGKLTAQLRAGAPYGLFLSADERYPELLAAAGLTRGAPVPYARGRLILWTTTAGVPPAADSLRSARIQRIALANPTTAPYGRATLDWLRGRGLDTLLAEKLVYGESIGQANQFVYTGAAEVGFTANSTVYGVDKFHRWAEVPDAPDIVQTGVVMRGPQEEDARRFRDFLLSPAGQAILRRYGYLAAE